MSGFIQMPDGHPGALGSATAEKAQANYTAAPVAVCLCRSLRVHAPARVRRRRDRVSRELLREPSGLGGRSRESCCRARVPAGAGVSVALSLWCTGAARRGGAGRGFRLL